MKTITKTIEVTQYMAFDGTVFDTEQDCRHHDGEIWETNMVNNNQFWKYNGLPAKSLAEAEIIYVDADHTWEKIVYYSNWWYGARINFTPSSFPIIVSMDIPHGNVSDITNLVKTLSNQYNNQIDEYKNSFNH